MYHDNWVDLSHKFQSKNIRAILSLKPFDTNGIFGRKKLAQAAKLDTNSLIIPRQTHSNKVTFCTKNGTIPDMDGIFTDNRQWVCSLQVADCLPIYFVNEPETVIGLVHAGWRGLVNGILSKSADLLSMNGFFLSNYEIVIGPSIHPCCFEVDEDVVNQFNSDHCVDKNNGKYQVDLQRIAKEQLHQFGFMKEKITLISECTYCEDGKYHSYRRDGDNAGRMIALLGWV